MEGDQLRERDPRHGCALEEGGTLIDPPSPPHQTNAPTVGGVYYNYPANAHCVSRVWGTCLDGYLRVDFITFTTQLDTDFFSVSRGVGVEVDGHLPQSLDTMRTHHHQSLPLQITGV